MSDSDEAGWPLLEHGKTLPLRSQLVGWVDGIFTSRNDVGSEASPMRRVSDQSLSRAEFDTNGHRRCKRSSRWWPVFDEGL